MDFDLPELDTKQNSEAGVAVPIRSLVNGLPIVKNGVPFTLTVLGPDSKAYREAMAKQRAADFQAQLLDDKSVDEEKSASDFLASITTGWTGVFDAAGNALAFNREAVAAMYLKYPAVRDQVDRFAGNRANFIAASQRA